MENITKEEFKKITDRVHDECATGKDIKIFLENKFIINKGENNDSNSISL